MIKGLTVLGKTSSLAFNGIGNTETQEVLVL